MDPADFLALAVENDRALRHRVDAVQVVVVGAEAVNERQKQQPVEAQDDRVCAQPDEESPGIAEPAGQQVEQMKGPENQQ